MMNKITLSHEEAQEIFKAINGIGELLKRLSSKSEDAPVKYAIMSNLAAIRMHVTGVRESVQTDQRLKTRNDHNAPHPVADAPVRGGVRGEGVTCEQTTITSTALGSLRSYPKSCIPP